MEFSASRKKILALWLISGFFTGLIISVLSMLYWNHNYLPELNINWRPVDDMFGMVILIPFGLLVSIAAPWGWASLAGLAISLWLKDIRPIVVSIVGAIIFGWHWPKMYVAFMGI